MSTAKQAKNVIGYCEPLSLRAGETISLMASSHVPGTAQLDLVRIVCGDPGSKGPGYIEEEISSDLPLQVDLIEQPLQPGSYAEVDLAGLRFVNEMRLSMYFLATRPRIDQVMLAIEAEQGLLLQVATRSGQLVIELGGEEVLARQQPLFAERWYRLVIRVAVNGTLTSSLVALPTRSPGLDIGEPNVPSEQTLAVSSHGGAALRRLLLARNPTGNFFDGRIARPELSLDDVAMKWDLAHDMAGRQLFDSSAQQRHGILYQLPGRGVTGPYWDGTQQKWTECSQHYDAIHFHCDDLYDAGWVPTATIEIPKDLASGIYAFRLRSAAGDDRVPFFVRPAQGTATADVALLMPTCTYIAYANHRMLFEGADFVASRTSLSAEHEYVRAHREVGLSCYEAHMDGSGVMFSSRRRPMLNLKPGADRWNFSPDTCLNAFLENLAIGHDIIADEDLHSEGYAALAPYRVIVTGTHPEYWSTAMLDGLEQWQRGGGRLMYLGGNGLYWRVAFSDAWPGALELRRAEDGVRNWQTEPGESYHAFGGEYGGLWRRLGRAPNKLVGVGFAAQGFERAVAYQRLPASADPRAAWIFDDVEQDLIGTSGLGGGAAGQEIDRFDSALGSPPHALILASATDFGPDMLRTKEEFAAAMVPQVGDPLVRADIVFYETPAGGAVFSVGSISWFGALARNNYSNDVARITANVVRRFADPALFEYQPEVQPRGH